MAFVAIGAGGGAAGMNDGGSGGGGAIALGVGAGIVLRQSVALSLDKREAELRQSGSAKQGYLIVERPTPYEIRLLTAHQARFTFGSARITPQSQAVLNDIAGAMKHHRDARIIITGYADDGGTTAMARRLATRRAQAATRYLEQHGVEAWRIERSNAGYVADTAYKKKGVSVHRRLGILITSQLLNLRVDLNSLESNIHQLQSLKDNDLMVKRSGPDSLKLTMAHRAAFIPGSIEPTPRGRALMDDLARLLKRHPYASVRIIGHW